MPTTYGKGTAELILYRESGYAMVDIRDDGLWLQESNERNLPLEWSWTYSSDFDRFDGPDPIKGLALPFDFTSEQLAAFMLAGVGLSVMVRYGDLSDGPHADALELIPGVGADRARHALKVAYANLREAESLV